MSTSARPWHVRQLPRVLARFGTGLWRHRDPVGVDGLDLALRRGVRDPPAVVTLPLEAGRIPT
jgi:hypothetical protein